MTTLWSLAILTILALDTMTDLVLTEVDAGSTHEVSGAKTVQLRLKENPSTGYRWSLDFEPRDAASILESHWTPAGVGVGGAGRREFAIRLTELGAVKVQAKLWREWQGEGSVIERQSFTLQVH